MGHHNETQTCRRGRPAAGEQAIASLLFRIRFCSSAAQLCGLAAVFLEGRANQNAGTLGERKGSILNLLLISYE